MFSGFAQPSKRQVDTGSNAKLSWFCCRLKGFGLLIPAPDERGRGIPRIHMFAGFRKIIPNYDMDMIKSRTGIFNQWNYPVSRRRYMMMWLRWAYSVVRDEFARRDPRTNFNPSLLVKLIICMYGYVIDTKVFNIRVYDMDIWLIFVWFYENIKLRRYGTDMDMKK